MHFLVGADGYERVTTHLFVARDPYLETDAVFGVKDSLIVDFTETPGGETQWLARYDFVLNRA